MKRKIKGQWSGLRKKEYYIANRNKKGVLTFMFNSQ